MNVVLIGDSIRMGYQQHVVAELAGWAHVWGPEENGGSSQKVLDHLDQWVLRRDPDVVHINTGLHDIRRPWGSTENQVSLWDYYANIREITQRVRSQTAARLIWATTTPIDEEWHNRVHEGLGDFRRFAADLATYNEGLVDQQRRLDLEIDDLHAIVVQAGPSRLLDQDGVHFTDEGYALLGKAVAAAIRQ